ncbi:sensor histidine kinase [Syntrophobacter fumaroxidans]|uniref:histidine kinase n=1 Tax=Syntrophobacter fumaroxidans (strain DSM 10017 / MPOB) TaxID=335543 RepID=A0LFY9_SYNFM|nr:ATP-binding protein [Syntrophobacter fumaroxidans]ABK16341.1 integral membrane sensor signal transduction histidine kinase [Syntrophobacter fumaroxidans MPOB]
MINRVGLRGGILTVIVLLVSVTIASSLLGIWWIRRATSLFVNSIDTSVAAVNVTQELETALAMQRGLLSYYFLDGNAEWLTQLDHHRLGFEEWLKKARELSRSDRHHELLNEIESKYVRHNGARDQAISLYDSGNRDGGLKLVRETRNPFYSVRELCEQYKQMQYREISLVRTNILERMSLLRSISFAVMGLGIALGLGLVILIHRRILEPIGRLAVETGRTGSRPADEVKALAENVHGLLKDVDRTQTQLQQSREHLLQSEKLALVGKLAAGVAHSIRNPLTSVKMRLFTMERTLDLSSNQKEDFDVISDEIRHIDNILQNFLEFSRPPKLKMQRISPSDVVDMAIQLLRHRIESYGVTLELYRQRRLPEIEGDPEQLKEVLVNLIVNACEAMGDGGKILIREEEGVTEPQGRVAVVRVSDNGPGIPEAIREKVFQPFFSTKEEGTGLGLSIAARIIEEHKGCLNLRARQSKGATFIITLPCKEDGAWLRS